MRANSRLAVAENASTAFDESIACGEDVFDLITDMMDAAARRFVEKSLNRRGISKRMDQFDFGVW